MGGDLLLESPDAEEQQGSQDVRGDLGATGDDSGVSGEDRAGEDGEVSGNRKEAETEVRAPSVANFLVAALQSSHDGMEVYLANNIIGAARQNEKRPAYLQWSVDDSAVVNVTGEPDRQDWFFMLRIPRDLVNELTGKQPKSLIIQP